MNNQFKDLFIVPEPWEEQLKFSNLTRGVRIRSLKHPEAKMSKSISDPSGTILLSDDPEQAAAKVMSATTDSVGSINYDFTHQPGISNLLTILGLLTDRQIEEVTAEWVGKTSYGELKQTVANTVSGFLADFHRRIEEVNDEDINSALIRDEEAVGQIANKKLYQVQQAVGIRPAS